ncbi:MAG: transcription elongation factor GreA [Flavobacteriales bacterium]|jgi:transcription elongation factor GreA|tara:strand:+ start:993 stop:1469 length:477 start_codon:yes stop_codon:yes gene_type:complete
MSLINYYTAEGLKRLREELDYMKSTERSSISNQIGEARDKGDLSENAEYDAAKEAQGMLEMKISKLEDALANARVLNEENIDLTKVGVLTKVKIKNSTNGAIMTYSLVAEKEADIKQNKISVSSPIGKGLLGKKIGEIAEIEVPRGVMSFEILEIATA